MPLPTAEEIKLFGPLIPPFGRNTREDKLKRIEKGEDIFFDIPNGAYDAVNNNKPINCIHISTENFNLLIENCPKYREDFFNEKYLWVIGTWGLRLIRENTRNEARVIKKYVCHTNLTGGLDAYQGGEIWFCEDNRIGINYFSDRYGATTREQWNAVIQHFKNVGYNNVVELFPMKDKK